jgi:hypothetical protein
MTGVIIDICMKYPKGKGPNLKKRPLIYYTAHCMGYSTLRGGGGPIFFVSTNPYGPFTEYKYIDF